jgi:hypothetical protein
MFGIYVDDQNGGCEEHHTGLNFSTEEEAKLWIKEAKDFNSFDPGYSYHEMQENTGHEYFMLFITKSALGCYSDEEIIQMVKGDKVPAKYSHRLTKEVFDASIEHKIETTYYHFIVEYI